MYWTAYLCLLAGALIPILVVFIAKSDDRLDVSKPRDVHLVQTGVRKRAYGAHLNGLEAFPFFAAAIVTAVQVEVEPELLNHAAIGWVVIRVAYTIAYLADLWKVRPTLWFMSVLTSTAIFLLALL